MLVRDIMSRFDAECTEDMTLNGVYELIQKSDHGFVVVIDSEAHRVPIGIVTEHSICKQIIGRGRNPRNLAAGNVLDARVGRIEDTAPVTECARFFDSETNEVIIVVNGKREFRGIVFKDSFVRVQENARQMNAPTAQSAGPQISHFGWAH
mgnify:CR=1 FL=1